MNRAWRIALRVAGAVLVVALVLVGSVWYTYGPASNTTATVVEKKADCPPVVKKSASQKPLAKKPAAVAKTVVPQPAKEVPPPPTPACAGGQCQSTTVIVDSSGVKVPRAPACAGGQCQSTTVIVNSPATPTTPASAPAPAPAPQPQQSTTPSGTAVIFANIAIDDGSGQLLPPVQGPQLGALVRSGMAARTLLPPSQPLMKFVVEIGSRQYTAVSHLVPWRLDDGRIIKAMHARVEVDEATARAHRGLVRSWVTGLNGEPVKFLNPPGDGVYRSLPDELAKLAAQGGKMMFHFIMPSQGAKSAPLQPPPPPPQS